MKESIQRRTKVILEQYVRQLEQRNGQLTYEEAQLMLAIYEVALPKIIKLGDIIKGFPCSKKKFDKMVSLLKNMDEKDYKFLIWDDLIEIIDMRGDSVMEPDEK